LALDVRQHDEQVFALLPEMKEKLGSFLGCLNSRGSLYTYLHPSLGANEVSWESWQLVTAIHDEGQDLILCDTHKVTTAVIHSC
jgi:hypothetical protein